jgi:hypothetical protein
MAQNYVTGMVTEVDGEPLIGVSVILKGTTIGTMTGIDGKYYISVPESKKAVLMFVFKGFQTVEVPVSGKGVIDVKLIEVIDDNVPDLSTKVKFFVGLRAGFNLTNIYGDYGTCEMNPGFQLGVAGELAINDKIAIQTGVLFAQQGCNEKLKDLGLLEKKMTMNLYYIQVPIHFQYKLNLGRPKLLLQAGPYLGYGLFGNIIVSDGDITTSETIKFGSGKNNLRPFDFGLCAGAGIQLFDRLQVVAEYNLGLAGMYSDVNVKNYGFAFTVTYLFGK